MKNLRIIILVNNEKIEYADILLSRGVRNHLCSAEHNFNISLYFVFKSLKN